MARKTTTPAQTEVTTERVVIGMDPHKRSVTIEDMTADERTVGHRRFDTSVAGYTALLDYVTRWLDRVWAIEGARASARMRTYATGQGRKTDHTDAHSIALVGVRVAGLRPVASNDQLEVPRLLVYRRRSLGEEHTRKVTELHRILLELIPGGAKTFLSGKQTRELLARIQPRDAVGKTRKRVAIELAGDLERIYVKTKDADKELTAPLAQTGTSLTSLRGIGPTGAPRLLVEVGDLTRFPDRNHFASWTGTAPIDASPGENVRHRLSRSENRQINRVVHTMAIVQLRNATEGRAYYDRKKPTGKTSMEALRCLKRRLSDVEYKTMLHDLVNGAPSGGPRPGRAPGRALGQRL